MNTNQPQLIPQVQQPRVYKTSAAQRQASKKYRDKMMLLNPRAYKERLAEYRETYLVEKAEQEASMIQQQEEQDYMEASGSEQQQWCFTRHIRQYYIKNGRVCVKLLA